MCAGVTGRARKAGSDGDAVDKDSTGIQGGVDVSRHFNYYAFEGGSGEQVWKHVSGAFQKNLADNAEELRPQHDFRYAGSLPRELSIAILASGSYLFSSQPR